MNYKNCFLYKNKTRWEGKRVGDFELFKPSENSLTLRLPTANITGFSVDANHNNNLKKIRISLLLACKFIKMVFGNWINKYRIVIHLTRVSVLLAIYVTFLCKVFVALSMKKLYSSYFYTDSYPIYIKQKNLKEVRINQRLNAST